MNLNDQLKELFAAASDSLDKEAFQDFLEKVKDLAEALAEEVKDKATDAFNSDQVQEFLEKAKDTANDLKDKLQNKN